MFKKLLTKEEEKNIIKQAEEQKRKLFEAQEKRQWDNKIKQFETEQRKYKLQCEKTGLNLPPHERLMKMIHQMQPESYYDYRKLVKHYRLEEIMEYFDKIGKPGIKPPEMPEDLKQEIQRREEQKKKNKEQQKKKEEDEKTKAIRQRIESKGGVFVGRPNID